LEGFVISQRIEVLVSAGKRAALRVQRDRTRQMCDGFKVLALLSVCDRQHVESVVVVGVLITDES
jgi:hypothetical protein